MLSASKKQVPAERVALARLTKAVPDGPELDNLVTTLYSAATKAGVTLLSIASPQPPNFGSAAAASTAGSGPSDVALSLAVSGTAGQIEQLVRVLDAEPRLFVVDNFNLSFGATPSGLSSSGAASVAADRSQSSTAISLRAFYASATSDNPGS